MSAEQSELKQKMMLLSDDQLLQMVTVDADQYRKEALDLAKAELTARGIDSAIAGSRPSSQEAEPEPDSDGRVCLICGGQMRQGILIAEKELTIIFNDSREERFVKASACSRCGQLSLAVDFENEVGN